jgi:hypothetical protein
MHAERPDFSDHSSCISPRTGKHKSAQGNALRELSGSPLSGELGRSLALSGLCGLVSFGFPKALPWAIVSLPLRGEARQNLKTRRRRNQCALLSLPSIITS